MKKLIFAVSFLNIFFLISCATQHSGCSVAIDQQGAYFVPRINNEPGHQILFEMHHEGQLCTAADVNKLAKRLFKKYAKKNKYDSFKILRTDKGESYGYYKYVVVFRKI